MQITILNGCNTPKPVETDDRQRLRDCITIAIKPYKGKQNSQFNSRYQLAMHLNLKIIYIFAFVRKMSGKPFRSAVICFMQNTAVSNANSTDEHSAVVNAKPREELASMPKKKNK